MNQELLQRIKRILIHPSAFHVYLWGVMVINELIDLQYGVSDFSYYLRNQAVIYSLMMVGVYVNLLRLVPMFLRKKNYAQYVVIFLFLHALLAGLWVQWHVINHTDCILLLAFRNHFSTLSITSLQFLALQYLLDYFQAERRRQKLENERNKLQLSQLKGQLNPHFLFNTMNNFYALAVGKSNKLPSLILQHADLLRYTLYETESQEVPLEKEIEFLANYVDLERIRLEDSVDVNMQVNGIIRGQMIAPMLLVPLFDNAFKYCASDGEVAFVDIEINVQLYDFQLRIYNSKDTETSQRLESGGIGLANVRRRLELIYEHSYELNIHDSKDVFGVELNIKL